MVDDDDDDVEEEAGALFRFFLVATFGFPAAGGPDAFDALPSSTVGSRSMISMFS